MYNLSPPTQAIQFDILNPIDYTVANNHDAVYGLIVKYGMPAPQTPAETLEAANIAVAQFGQPFAHDLAMLHPDLEALLKEAGHYGTCCSSKSNLAPDNIAYNLPALREELARLEAELLTANDDARRQQIVDRIAWLKLTIANQENKPTDQTKPSTVKDNLPLILIAGLFTIAIVSMAISKNK